MFCRDKSLTLLAKYGYNVVRLPRTGIEPLDVLGRDRNGIETLGRLPTIWESETAPPSIDHGNVAAEIKTVTTASLKLSLGLHVLENVLSGLGAAAPRLDVAYSGTKSLQFSFRNIQISKVDPFEVGQFLMKGDLQLGPWVKRYFQDDDTEAYIITEVLKTDSVTVIASSKKNTKVELDVSAIQDLVGADIGVEPGSTSKSEVTYKGLRHLTFGFKAFQIGYDFDEDDVGEWHIIGTGDDDVYLDASEEGAKSVLLAERNGRIGRVDLR